MSDSHGPSNPFATRFTRPGAIPFLFPPGQSVESLITKLAENGWRGEIVGPHGVGKSTLLATLKAALTNVGRKIVPVSLPGGESKLPRTIAEATDWDSSTQVIVDGYEQLSWWSRRRLWRKVRVCEAGLLITSHTPTGLPPLLVLQPQLEVAQQVVRSLVANSPDITDHDIVQTFNACQGNIRETLFRLYDLYELRK